MIVTHHYDSPLGGITLAAEGDALTGLWFDGQRFLPEVPPAGCAERLPVFDEADRWLDLYFSGRDPGFTPALQTGGSAFRRKVWEILLTIPYGQTTTYGRIAERMAGNGAGRVSARAVGGAVGHNPVSLIIPCHRVVVTGGRLGGYAGGTERKAELLRMEGIHI